MGENVTFTSVVMLKSDLAIYKRLQLFPPCLTALYFRVSCVLFQGPLVGMNPVQIRATADLYPSSRSSPSGHPDAPAGLSPY